MRWQVHSERSLYADEWLDIRTADVELPDGRRIDHRLIRTAPGAGAVVTDARDRVLLIRRHRFITDSWGWEIPLGWVDEGEMPRDAAAREAEEETGWRPGPLRPLLSIQPSNGLSDSLHHIYRADSATHIGPPSDPCEAEQVEWVPLADIRRLIDNGEIVCGTTMASLLHVLLEHLPHSPLRPEDITRETNYDPERRFLLPDLPDLFS
ncbi:NUDIX domain-containing protein [Nonomuraea phyllanthi]|uniref:NUDIX domain-containing protein n=1 Tax=Nonomuraea phyllanthi TaxID=2219224 RepID=UPI001292CF37|nr:NUDIX hydrolase [Nonomuraea phyllanthi]QFY12630.1 NUDIX domain-containing protein [Nonomuraea phyllanthi]